MKNLLEFWLEVKSFSSEWITVHREKPDIITYKVTKDVIHVIEAAPALARIKKLEADLKQVREIGVEMQRETNRKLSTINTQLENDLIEANAKLAKMRICLECEANGFYAGTPDGRPCKRHYDNPK